MIRVTSVIFVFLMFSISANAAPKTDIVVFKNGDRLTGELKKVSRGILTLSTDAAGTVDIEWPKVASVQSTQNIQVETESGQRYFGHLDSAAQAGYLTVETEGGATQLSLARVVNMRPIDSTWRQALNVDVSLGYNFSKANSVEQGNFALDADYRTRIRVFSLEAASNISGSSNQEFSRSSNLLLQYTRLLEGRLFYIGTLGFEQNDELGLDLRSSIGGGYGKYFVQSNEMLFSTQVGLLYSQQQYDGVPGTSDSLELALGLDWEWFRFDDPQLDWSTKLDYFPNLTDSGKRRAQFETSLTWEIIGDLDWVLSFYSTYDNNSTSVDASNYDYGINTMISYEFL